MCRILTSKAKLNAERGLNKPSNIEMDANCNAPAKTMLLMAKSHPLALEALMLQVASKGGTTEAGLLKLRDPLQSLIHDTFEATLLKAKDLSK